MKWLWAVVAIGCSGNHPAGELAVPDVAQATDYTCSASALQAVLAYYGTEITETKLAAELGATPTDGAPPDAIERVARAHGLDANVHDGTTLAQLSAELARGHPVIVDLQAWADPPRSTWTDDWDDGHYVVLVAIEHDTLVFEDPSLEDKRATLTAAELDARWHDEDHHRRHDHTAIFVHTPPPAHPRSVSVPARAHMD